MITESDKRNNDVINVCTKIRCEFVRVVIIYDFKVSPTKQMCRFINGTGKPTSLSGAVCFRIATMPILVRGSECRSASAALLIHVSIRAYTTIFCLRYT